MLWNMDCLLPTLLTQFVYLGIHLPPFVIIFAMWFLNCVIGFTHHTGYCYASN
jgi:hypothetical protein